jgi:hypothetical protein
MSPIRSPVALIHVTLSLCFSTLVGLPGQASAGFSPSSLTGTYAFVEWQFSPSTTQPLAPSPGAALPTPLGFGCTEGTYVFDGVGSFTRTYINNQDGVISASIADSGTYTVAPNGAVHISVTTGTLTGLMLSGQLSSNGQLLVAQGTSGEAPRSVIGGKVAPGPYTNASLNGTAALIGYQFDLKAAQPNAPAVGAQLPAPKGFNSFVGTLTLNPATATASGSATNNKDGVVSSVTINGTYSVASDGTVQLYNSSNMQTHIGKLVNNGNTLLVMGTLNNAPDILVATLESGTYSNASLKGHYAAVQRKFQSGAAQGAMPPAGTPLPAPIGFQTDLGSVVTDATANFTVSGQDDVDGHISFTSFSSGTYAVASDGTLTVTDVNGNVSAGQVLIGGAAFQLTTTSAGKDPQLIFAVQVGVTPVPSDDFRGNGNSDLLWRNTSGATSMWLMKGTTPEGSVVAGPYSGWTLLSGEADFNGDGKSDLLWTNTNGAASIWLMNGTTPLGSGAYGPYPGWTVVSGNADFNGDGNTDLVWTNTNGAVSIWLMSGTTVLSSAAFGPYPGWTVLSGDADYNGDGKTDLLWTNSNGAVSIWLMNGTTPLGSGAYGPYPGWTVVSGQRDFNGDGKSDLLWTNSDGAASIWLMNGTTPLGSGAYGPYAGWSIVGSVGDFNGDGKTDLLWTNSNGAASIWLMNGTTPLGSGAYGPYSGWTATSGRSGP